MNNFALIVKTELVDVWGEWNIYQIVVRMI